MTRLSILQMRGLVVGLGVMLVDEGGHKNMAHSVAQPCKLPYQTSCWLLIDRETLDIVGSDYGTMTDRVAGIV